MPIVERKNVGDANKSFYEYKLTNENIMFIKLLTSSKRKN